MYSYLYVSKEPTPRCLLSWCNCKRTQWKSGPLKQLSINRRQENVDYVINFLFLINKQKIPLSILARLSAILPSVRRAGRRVPAAEWSAISTSVQLNLFNCYSHWTQ